MLSSKPKTTDSKAPEHRYTVGTFLKPDFRASIRPIGESTRIFVNLIAMLFAMNGLFPKNHPAFANDSNVRLTLGGVIGTAWNNLSFTQKDMPKVLFFFAVVSCMVVTTLAVVIGAFSLFVGTAHAQAPSATAFFTVDKTQDLAQNWIDYLFNGQPLLATYNQDNTDLATVTQANNTVGGLNLQCAMMTALGFYSDAVLMVAALILFYHLAAMVVETAHHGVVMGKRANQIWAPIRLVVAVGLLVPIGNGSPAACGNSGAGLNSAQYITIKIAELGSALATNTWQKFITTLAGAQFNFVPPPQPAVDQLVKNMFLMEGCAAANNYFSTNVAEQGTSSPDYIISPPVPRPGWQNGTPGTFYDYSSQDDLMYAKDMCGYIFIPAAAQQPSTDNANDALETTVPPKTSILEAITQAQNATLASELNQIHQMVASGGSGGQPDISYWNPLWNAKLNGGETQPPPDNQDYQTIVNQYTSDLRAALNTAFGGVNTQLKTEVLTTPGWIAAGTWLNTIARDQGSIVNASYDAMPAAHPPSIIYGPMEANSAIAPDVNAVLYGFRAWLIGGNNTAQMASAASPCSLQGAAANSSVQRRDEQTDDPIKLILQSLDSVAKDTGVWSADQNYTCDESNTVTAGNPNGTPFFTLGTQFTSGNPMGELANYGFKNIQLALHMLNDMIIAIGVQAGASALSGFFDERLGKGAIDKSKLDKLGQGVSGAIGGLGGGAATIFGFLAVIFLTIGVTLGYVVPLIPFMHFFFGAVAWGLVLLEAVIAMPLVALAHLNPEGDGLPGAMAKQAYFMLLGLFLRPILMIFGLIASLILFMLAVFLLNKLYAVTVVGTGGLGQGFATFSRIVYTVIYVFIVYSCATNVFKIIDQLPESAMRWMSIQIQHQRLADGGSVLQGAAAPVTAIAGQQGVQAI